MDTSAMQNGYQYMNDAQLIDILENLNRYDKDRVAMIINAAKSRELVLPKLYYYRKEDKNEGPFDIIEFYEYAKNNSFTSNSYVWKKGTDNWVQANNIPWLDFGVNSTDIPPPFIKTDIKVNDQESPPPGFGTTYILMFVYASIWVCITLYQLLFNSVVTLFFLKPNYYLILIIWNSACTIIYFIIATGIKNHKQWSYSWGTGLIGISFISGFIEILFFAAYLRVLLFPLEIILIILLNKYKACLSRS